MDMDTVLYYLGIQTYRAMQAEEAVAQKDRQVEILTNRIQELESTEPKAQPTKKEED